MTRRERGKNEGLELVMPILQPLGLFFGLLFLLSLVGRSLGNALVEQIALSLILVLVAADAGFLFSKQSSLKGWMMGGIVAGVFLGVLCLGALFLYARTPSVENLALTGAKILVGALLGAMIGEKKRPRRRK